MNEVILLKNTKNWEFLNLEKLPFESMYLVVIIFSWRFACTSRKINVPSAHFKSRFSLPRWWLISLLLLFWALIKESTSVSSCLLPKKQCLSREPILVCLPSDSKYFDQWRYWYTRNNGKMIFKYPKELIIKLMIHSSWKLFNSDWTYMVSNHKVTKLPRPIATTNMSFLGCLSCMVL